ncbi:unnamed protein product [Cercospora beticola]|nr:unnamed protein product [Cercospora beticola]
MERAGCQIGALWRCSARGAVQRASCLSVGSRTAAVDVLSMNSSSSSQAAATAICSGPWMGECGVRSGSRPGLTGWTEAKCPTLSSTGGAPAKLRGAAVPESSRQDDQRARRVPPAWQSGCTASATAKRQRPRGATH